MSLGFETELVNGHGFDFRVSRFVLRFSRFAFRIPGFAGGGGLRRSPVSSGLCTAALSAWGVGSGFGVEGLGSGV